MPNESRWEAELQSIMEEYGAVGLAVAVTDYAP